MVAIDFVFFFVKESHIKSFKKVFHLDCFLFIAWVISPESLNSQITIECKVSCNQKDNDVNHGKSELALDFRVVVQVREDEIAVRGSQYDDLVENFHSHLKLVCQGIPNEIVNELKNTRQYQQLLLCKWMLLQVKVAHTQEQPPNNKEEVIA